MKSTSPLPSIAIVGAGPTGLMVAEQLAAKGLNVTVYDQMPSAGRKFLMAGCGGLNLTHSESLDQFKRRYKDHASWLNPLLDRFPPDALRAWCHGLGQETFVGSSGRVFPREMKTSPLLRAWLKRLDGLGVHFALRHTWRGWADDQRLVFSDGQGQTQKVTADLVVLALGGASWPRLGSNGTWVELLHGEGISVAPLKATNCGFVVPWSTFFKERFAGHPLKPIKLSFEGETLQGEAMITHMGIEGGGVYALSSLLRTHIEKHGDALLTLDLKPGLSKEELTARLEAPRGSRSNSTHVRKAAGLSAAALAVMRESPQGVILPDDPGALSERIKATQLKLIATSPLDRAISSAGGVRLSEVDAHLMLLKKPGVFVAGEMLDWEAPTGGYLLQACFSMAVTVAEGVERHARHLRDAPPPVGT